MLLNEFLKEHAKVQRLKAALEEINQRLKTGRKNRKRARWDCFEQISRADHC